MTIFSSKLHTFQLKRYCVSLIIFTIIWTHNANAQVNFINSQRYNIGQNWKRDANTTPITTPLKINLTFDPSLNQWTFPIQFGTPPQTMNIPIDMTYNLLWVVSEFCISPFGDACNTSRSINLFNTSLSNTISGNYQEFTIKYINGSELVAIWANDTIIINNQTFEQMAIGFPKDIKGNESVIIPDTTTGQIGLMPYQNYMLNNFANQTVGIALSSTGGSITFGGIDLEYIIGNNESNIAYQPLPQLTEPNQQFMFNVTNIYINNMAINISGLTWFNNEIQNIQLDDNSANILANLLPGGIYSNGVVIVD
ncbi:20036_t:CDS:2, partial [Gigaspora margarita]